MPSSAVLNIPHRYSPGNRLSGPNYHAINDEPVVGIEPIGPPQLQPQPQPQPQLNHKKTKTITTCLLDSLQLCVVCLTFFAVGGFIAFGFYYFPSLLVAVAIIFLVVCFCSPLCYLLYKYLKRTVDPSTFELPTEEQPLLVEAPNQEQEQDQANVEAPPPEQEQENAEVPHPVPELEQANVEVPELEQENVKVPDLDLEQASIEVPHPEKEQASVEASHPEQKAEDFHLETTAVKLRKDV